MHSWIWSLWVMAVLTAGSSLPSFPKHTQVEESMANVTVTCRKDFDGDITWTFNEEELDRVGPEFKLLNFDESLAGEYSCYGADEILDTVHVLLKDTPDSTTPELKCWAENYNCTFHCTWKHRHYTVVRLRNERDNGTWVSSSPEGVFEVPHLTDAHSEEATPLKVTLEALTTNKDRFLQINKTFYLREIIQPPSPQIEVFKRGDPLEVDIKPAKGWATPSSYYPLEYQIEYRKKDNGQVVQQLCCKEQGQTNRHTHAPDCWTKVRCKIHVRVASFRVRSRDPLLKSNWGQWTEWTNAGRRAKQEKKREKGMKSYEKKKKKGKGKKKGAGKGKAEKSSLTCNETRL
ncbi:hypothetical protein ACEWY4_010847 [Coilia grayii]|uniref:Interleukin-12 beta central domain-containing protein n=1 Tax=Coilia grayii TaxID=363190 RepID=A0ABD1K319_9TELE